MAENEQGRKVLLSLRDVDVKFNVRGRILSAIRGVSLDIYENECIAIVGESGSGKSVLTKTFAGMLDSNGFISNGSIIFSDDELSKTTVSTEGKNAKLLAELLKSLNKSSVLERGAEDYNAITAKKAEILASQSLTAAETEDYDARIKDLTDDIVDANNFFLTLDKHENEQDYNTTLEKLEKLKADKAVLVSERDALIAERKAKYAADKEKQAADKEELARLKAERDRKIKTPAAEIPAENPYGLTVEQLERNRIIAFEILLSIARYPFKYKTAFTRKLKKGFRAAMIEGRDLTDENVLNSIFEEVTFRVEYRSYDEEKHEVHGYGIINCAKVKFTNDWQQIRGCRIATVFQDPMTSLNPVITIGKQIMTVVLKHQKCSYSEARKRTIDIMGKVGIPDPEKRFDDYPFQYSGGMRQRIVIAIALSCQPKILICDEPTTALDVTIQAQIIRLIKDLQKDLGFTTVFITHDLGVVANVAERVAVLYGGQIVELGTVEDIFYDPRHPYTWALLSSLPQLTERGTELFSIPGTPPSLYNKIVGDAFAPRNKYVMAIDLVEEPPMFKVSDTHYAKTWLLDPDAPKVDPPEIIQNLHEKMLKTYNDFNDEEANIG